MSTKFIPFGFHLHGHYHLYVHVHIFNVQNSRGCKEMYGTYHWPTSHEILPFVKLLSLETVKSCKRENFTLT